MKAPDMFNQRSSNTASPNTPDAPAPPAGYQLRSVVRYPVVVVTVTSAAIFFITTPLFIWLAWRLQAVSSHPFLLPLTIEDSFLALAGSIATVGIHELTHILILRAYGYKTSCGVAWRQFAVYAAAFGQWQPRQRALLVTLAPLVVITALSLPLLAVADRSLVVLGFSALLTNTSGAAGDLFIAWRLLQLPRNTLIYDVDPTQMLIFALRNP